MAAVAGISEIADRERVWDGLAADTGVTQQSPQALLLRAGQKVAWNASHYSVTEESLKEAVETA